MSHKDATGPGDSQCNMVFLKAEWGLGSSLELEFSPMNTFL